MGNSEQSLTPYEQIDLVMDYLDQGFAAEDIDFEETLKNLYFDPEKWANAIHASISFFL